MIVTSAAVPQVVGRAIIGTLFLVVLAIPSSDFISAKLGLLYTIPIAFEVSITEPPPTATMKSAPDFLKASKPSLQFLIVGFCLISKNSSNGISALFKTSFTLSKTPQDAKTLSLTKRAFLYPLVLTSVASSVLQPAPK